MNNETLVYYFALTKPGMTPDLWDTLMAIRETDLVFCPARRKVETDALLARIQTRGEVAGETDCGEHLASRFSGFLIKPFDGRGFRVRLPALRQPWLI